MRTIFSTAACAVAVAMAAPASAAPAARIPDFSGIWWHPSLPGPEPLATGPTTVTNRSRSNGASDYSQLFVYYTNPILKPGASEIVIITDAATTESYIYPNPATLRI